MTKIDDQQQRNAATMALLESMAAFVDELLSEREEREQLEADWQARCIKPTADEEVSE